MDRSSPPSAELACRIGYTGTTTVYASGDISPVVQPFTVKIFLEWRAREMLPPNELVERKGVGKIIFGVFKPLSFPDAAIPHELHQDITAPLRRAWSKHAQRPSDWLLTRFPDLRPEFLVFASVETDRCVGGRRIALVVMTDIINRHVPPGGIVLLNPYPLQYLMTGDPAAKATPEEKQRGVSALKRHYNRIGLQTIETEPDVMVLQRPSTPLQPPRGEIHLTREKFRSMPDVNTYEGLY